MAGQPADETDEQEAELLRQVRDAREGDLRAFELLVARYQKRILANCLYLTRDAANSEDLAQEVFVKAFFGLRGLESDSVFPHWLRKIKVHHCLNHLRKRSGRDFLSIENEGIEKNQQLHVAAVAQRDAEADQNRQRIESVLNSMPATLRIPLIMCDMDEMPYDEIAASLGIGLSAVKMRIKRARELFRRLYRTDTELPVEGGAAA